MDNPKAVFSQKSFTKILSPHEFQEMLNLWFHEKGVLTELRMHLRFKLVSLLKDTTIGRNINQNNSHSNNLPNQAFNLIVAEYLMQNKYYYSLSIFNTETSFTSVLPDYSIRFNEEKQNEFCNVFFDRENIFKILDLIGLTKSNPLYDELLSIYFNAQENNSILSCLITLMCQPPKVITEVNDGNLSKIIHAMLTDNSTEINFMQRIEELLTLTNLPNCYVKKLSQNINLFYEIKRQQQKKELLDVIDQLKSEVTFKDRTIKKLHKAKHILQGQLLKLNENYDKEKLHLENILHTENLSNENVLLQKKQIEHSKFKNDESEDNLKLNNLPIPKEEDKIKCQLPHCSKDCTENMKLNEDLLNENTILKKENKIQKVMLQKLFLIYKNLLSKFENCQIKLSFLNSTINKDYTEELFNNLYGDHLLEVEVQKHTDYSEVSSDSITEEILHQVRTKLQTLEDETKEIEDKYKNVR